MSIDVWNIEEYREGQPLRPLLWLQENDPVHWHHEYEEDGPASGDRQPEPGMVP